MSDSSLQAETEPSGSEKWISRRFRSLSQHGTLQDSSPSAEIIIIVPRLLKGGRAGFPASPGIWDPYAVTWLQRCPFFLEQMKSTGGLQKEAFERKLVNIMGSGKLSTQF